MTGAGGFVVGGSRRRVFFADNEALTQLVGGCRRMLSVLSAVAGDVVGGSRLSANLSAALKKGRLADNEVFARPEGRIRTAAQVVHTSLHTSLKGTS